MIASALRRADRLLLGPLHERFPRLLDRLIGDADSLLDVGCGSASPVYLATRRIPHSVGVDGYAPALEQSRAQGLHRDYRHLDVMTIGDAFKPRSFDVVVCSEVIEHVSKDDGYRLMISLERLARKRVIIATPNGFVPQAAHDGNRLQEHLSGWRVWDFEDRGYRVLGFGGWRPMKGAYADPKWWPKPFWWRVSMLTDPLLERWPEQSFQLVAVKEVAS